MGRTSLTSPWLPDPPPTPRPTPSLVMSLPVGSPREVTSQEVPGNPNHPAHHSLAPHGNERVHRHRARTLTASCIEQWGLPVQWAATGLGARPDKGQEEGAVLGRPVMDRQGGSMISKMSLPVTLKDTSGTNLTHSPAPPISDIIH